jgi:hypothetical protein
VLERSCGSHRPKPHAREGHPLGPGRCRRRFRPLRHPVGAHPGPARRGRRSTSRSSPTTAASTTGGWESCCATADPPDDLVLRRGEQGVRAAVPLRASSRSSSPRRAPGRADARRRVRHPAFFTMTGVGTQVAEGGMPWRYAADGVRRRRLTAQGDPRVRPGWGARSTSSSRRSSPTSRWCGRGRATGTATSSSTSRPQLQPAGRDGRAVTIAEVEDSSSRASSTPTDPPAGHLRPAGRAAHPRAGRGQADRERRPTAPTRRAARRPDRRPEPWR